MEVDLWTQDSDWLGLEEMQYKSAYVARLIENVKLEFEKEMSKSA